MLYFSFVHPFYITWCWKLCQYIYFISW